MQPAARVGDMHTCTQGSHKGGPITVGCPTVQIGNQAAARVGDAATCEGPPDSIAKGSATVKIGNQAAARLGDPTAYGGAIAAGFTKVLIGG